jgi:hypothetical protein
MGVWEGDTGINQILIRWKIYTCIKFQIENLSNFTKLLI